MKRIITALVACLLPVLAFGQTLADKVPSNTIFYIGFKGAKALDAEYQQSHLKPVLESTDLSVLVSDRFHERLANVIARQNEQLAEAWPSLVEAAKQMWQYPSAIAVYANGSEPQVALLCEAGGEAGALVAKIRPMLPTGTPLQCDQEGDFVILGNSIADIQPLLAAGAAGGLGKTPAFVSAMKQVNAQGAVVAYVNADAWFDAMAKSEPQAAQRRAALGLDGVHGAAISGSFAGKDWLGQAFIASIGPREGLASLLDGAPISAEAMKIVPQTAIQATICQCDLSSLLTRARATMAKLDPTSVKQMDQGLSMANSAINLDIEKQLLPPLGTEWIVYTDANIGGTQFMGLVIANRLRDPAKAEAALTQLQQKLLTLARAGAEIKGMRVPLVEKVVNGTKIHSVSLPMVAPTWAIRDGVLYVGLYPQVVEAAAEFAGSGKPCIADAPAIAASLKSANGKLQSLAYIDMPQSIGVGYGYALLFSRYIGFLDLMTGVETPIMPVPPLPVLREHSGPILITDWSDANGWHMQMSCPFPGSHILGSLMAADVTMMQVPVASLGVSILLPSLSRAREKANEVRCASNMRQIGQAVMLWANDHQRQGGPYPDNLGQLLEETISPEVFICPSTSKSMPAGLRTMPLAQQQQWVNQNAAYIYVGMGLNMGSNPEFIVLYEPLDNHGREGMNVLFADGHVDWETPASFQQVKQNAMKLGQKWPATAK